MAAVSIYESMDKCMEENKGEDYGVAIWKVRCMPPNLDGASAG